METTNEKPKNPLEKNNSQEKQQNMFSDPILDRQFSPYQEMFYPQEGCMTHHLLCDE